MVCTSDERAIPAEKERQHHHAILPYPPFSSYRLNAQLGHIYHTLIKFSVIGITDDPSTARPHQLSST
jgi:hypothetical protein